MTEAQPFESDEPATRLDAARRTLRLARLIHQLRETVHPDEAAPPADPHDDYWKAISRRVRYRRVETVQPDPRYL